MIIILFLNHFCIQYTFFNNGILFICAYKIPYMCALKQTVPQLFGFLIVSKSVKIVTIINCNNKLYPILQSIHGLQFFHYMLY